MTLKSSVSMGHSLHLRVVYAQPTFKCKNVLQLEPDTLWTIEFGVVRSLTWDEDGKSMTLGFWGKGDVIGHPLSRMRPYQVECLTTVQISKLSPDSSELQKALLAHAWTSEELLQILHQTTMTDRLIHLLIWLGDRFGQPVITGTRLDLRLTHQDIADTIGSTRVSVTRLLKQMEREGKIKRSQRNLILCF